MDFSNYIFRSHMVGKIVYVPNPLTLSQMETLEAYKERLLGNGKPLTEKQHIDYISLQHKFNESKVFKLTDTSKNILNDIAFYEKHGRRNLLDVKYMKKGIEKEKDSRDLLSSVLGILFTKDDERRSNEWVTGKRDVKCNEAIIDIKTSWDFQTFNKHLIESSNEVYLRQLDCYMELWNINNSLLCHCLVDTPFHIINDELRKLNYKIDIMNNDGDIHENKIQDVKKLICSHIFTRQSLEDYCQESSNVYIEWFNDFQEIPNEQRVHMIAHNLDKTRLEQRNECIIIAREYMNNTKPINNRILNI